MRFHDSPPVTRSKKLSTKLFRLYSDESIISYRMILNRYSLFCVYISSHDIECLQNVCDKCLLLHNGQIREINMEEVDREEIAKILSEGE